METKKEEQPKNSGPTAPPSNIPEWVMHLLTGLGTMGAEYMLFIKPLQEKMELQSRLIKEQGERIDELEELLHSRRKPKRGSETRSDEREEESHIDNDNELFEIKRKPAPVSKYAKHARINL